MTKIGMVAVHHPRREHRDEFVERVRRAAEVISRSPGCLGADCWTTDDGAVVSTAQWLSKRAMQASFAAAEELGVDFTYDDREAKPRDITMLVSTT